MNILSKPPKDYSKSNPKVENPPNEDGLNRLVAVLVDMAIEEIQNERRSK